MSRAGSLASEPMVVDVDAHVYEPPELWDRYVPDGYQAAARAALWHGFDEHGARLTVRNDEPVDELDRSRLIRSAIWRPGMTPDDIGSLDPNVHAELNPGAWDAAVRLSDMDTLGIDQAVLFPTLFAEHFPMIRNPDVAAVLARAYNDWVLAHASLAPDRLHPVAVVPLQSLIQARQELRRVADLGFRAVLIRPMFHDVKVVEVAGRGQRVGDGFLYHGLRSPRGPFVNDSHFRPLWEQMAELGLVACCPSVDGSDEPRAHVGGELRRARRRAHGHRPLRRGSNCLLPGQRDLRHGRAVPRALGRSAGSATRRLSLGSVLAPARAREGRDVLVAVDPERVHAARASRHP